MGLDSGASGLKRINHNAAGGLTHVVSPRLEGQAPHREAQSAQVLTVAGNDHANEHLLLRSLILHGDEDLAWRAGNLERPRVLSH